MQKIIFSIIVTVVLIGAGAYSYLSVEADTVSVTASVAQSVTCSTATTSTAFGTLTTGSISTASPNVTSTLSCNYGAGCVLQVNDAGGGGNPGLWNATASDIIQSQTATLSAGTEGYGIQATTTAAGSGAALSVSATYNKTGNDVGGLALSAATLGSASAPISGREILVTHKAAIGALTAAGSYTDTITYGCVGN